MWWRILSYLFLIGRSASQVTWFTRPTEVKLNQGQTLELVCQVTGSCCTSLRIWRKGAALDTIMNAGIPSNDTKYNETIDSLTLQFSLHIYNAMIDDIIDDYRCEYGFGSSLLSAVSKDHLCYEPISTEKQDLVKEFNGSIYYSVNITNIFPIPTCTAMFEDKNLTSDLVINSGDNFPLKYAEISLMDVEYTCSGNGKLAISCTFGTCGFDLTENVGCSPGTTSDVSTTVSSTTERKGKPDGNDQNWLQYILPPVGICLVLVVLVMILVKFFIGRKQTASEAKKTSSVQAIPSSNQDNDTMLSEQEQLNNTETKPNIDDSYSRL